MSYELRYLAPAAKTLRTVAGRDVVKYRKVVKCLRQLALDPRYPALSSHKYTTKTGPNGEEVWESYVENNVPAAWRVFWTYGPDESDLDDPAAPATKIISVLAITPHP